MAEGWRGWFGFGREDSGPSGLTEAVVDGEAGWSPVGGRSYGASGVPRTREAVRTAVRRLVEENAYAKQALRLLENYVVGPDLRVTHGAVEGAAEDRALAAAADRVWAEFRERTAGHVSPREFARRLWRDGECFVRFFAEFDGELTARFVDPERVGSDGTGEGVDGVVSEPGDIEGVRGYELLDPGTGRVGEVVPAGEMVHARYGVDANERRGASLFGAMIGPLERYDAWLETELAARRLQSSIVLWRKVQGSPSRVAGAAEGLSGGTDGEGARREKVRPGTIVTTSSGTDLKFLQPDTNFGDALPLGRSLLLAASAAAGLPEFMLTADASNGNFASTMVAEGPAVKFFEAEQQRISSELNRVRRAVLLDAERRGVLPEGATGSLRATWTFPSLVNRDRASERAADARLIAAGVLSRAEVARRDGVDPGLMRDEIGEERVANSE